MKGLENRSSALIGNHPVAVLISPSASDGSRIFLQSGNLTDILRQVSLIGIISLAMTFVILTGGIDLSVGSILALSTTLTAMALTRAGGLRLFRTRAPSIAPSPPLRSPAR